MLHAGNSQSIKAWHLSNNNHIKIKRYELPVNKNVMKDTSNAEESNAASTPYLVMSEEKREHNQYTTII